MEGALTVIPLPTRPAPKSAVMVMEGREVLKKFHDPLFGEFVVYKTRGHRQGFWEEDVMKVQKLIDAFKGGHNVVNACIHAGVQRIAFYRFLEVYPSFRDIKEACESYTSFGAMNTIQTGVRERPDLAFKYVEKRGDFNFETRKKDAEPPPLQPTVAVAVQVNNNIDEKRIEGRIDERLTSRVSKVSASSETEGNGSVAESVQG